MPIDRAGMLEAPVDGDPARPPRFQAKLLRSRGVPANFKEIEILPGKNIPVAVEKGAPQIFRQGLERAAIRNIVGENRIIFEPLKSRGWDLIHPQRFHPSVTDVSWVGGAGHVAEAARHGAAIARG